MARLTDLEGAALAEIGRRGSATSYVVAQAFAESPSEYWSGSAGSFYPAIKRLAERGYLLANEASTGRRPRVDYSLSDLGRAAMEDWLLDPIRASGMGFDPLRTRLVYLGLVSEKRRRKFLSEVRERTDEFAAKPVFADIPNALSIHKSWLKARTYWLELIDFIAG
jgi:DNA-binding PadR family transcriptional regulator